MFFVILVLLLESASRLVSLSYENIDELTIGFYDQPDDTLEVVFLGASTIRHGVIPTQLYEEYGICSYDLVSSAQPMYASYYWLREAYRFHSDSLKCVVLDVASMQHDRSEQKYIVALQRMRLSKNKYHAAKDITDTLEDFIYYMSPLYAYHDRWKELTDVDFRKINEKSYAESLNTGLRGYGSLYTQLITQDYNYTDVPVLSYFEESEEKEEFGEEQVLYFQNIVNFCNENELQLILLRTPTHEEDWSDAQHNAVQELADESGLEFIDFNYSPYAEEIDYDAALDKSDSKHLNQTGAEKLTAWVGQYLVENGELTDTRGQEEYSFMEEELEQYQRELLPGELLEIVDPAEYMETVNEMEDYTIFISVDEDGAFSLTQEQKDRFLALGLDELSSLEYRGSYLAVLENGEVKVEMSSLAEESEDPLQYSGYTKDGNAFTLKSGGFFSGNISSCVIGGTEYSLNSRGINIVVYDNRLGKEVDSAVFDTYASSVRSSSILSKETLEEYLDEGVDSSSLSGEMKDAYLYELRQNDVYLAKKLKSEQSSLKEWLETFGGKDYLLVFSAQGDGLCLLDEEDKEALKELGLLQGLGEEDMDSGAAWAAVLEGGEIVEENRADAISRIEINTSDVSAISCGRSEENAAASSIVIQGQEYSSMGNGVNLVIYNTQTELVVGSLTFGEG